MCAQKQDHPVEAINQSHKFDVAAIVIIYPSWTMKNALASVVNLVTLLIGITIGIMLAPHLEKPAQALSAAPQASAPQPAIPIQSPVAASSGPEQIQPMISAGNAGFYLLLAHHIQSDELTVNGLDMMKLQQGELNLLSRIPGVYPWEIQNIITDARNTHLYQVAAPKPPAPAATNPPVK